MDIATFAAKFNVDPTALAGLIEFLKINLRDNAMFRAAFLDHATRDAALREAVTAWRDKSVQLYTELLENKTERARIAREALAEQTWAEARRRQGLPV